MRRFIIFLLLCVLPLQFALAGAVDALEHADEGHSEASHTSATGENSAAAESDDNEDLSPRCHGECGNCHFFHSLALFGSRVAALAIQSAPDLLSLPSAEHKNRVTAQRPERPKWSQLA